jgi:hypothetical protein
MPPVSTRPPKSIPSLYKYLFVIILLTISLLGCKKEVETPFALPQVSPPPALLASSARESSITSSKVREWLGAQRINASATKDEITGDLLSNLRDSEMYSESLNANENLIIVPLVADNFSRNLDSASAFTPLQYLVLVENSSGDVRRGDIMFFYPKGGNIAALPANSFHNFFASDSSFLDGTFALVNLEDVLQYEMDFENHKISQFRLWEERAPLDQGSITCYHSWLVTTYYYSDGS